MESLTVKDIDEYRLHLSPLLRRPPSHSSEVLPKPLILLWLVIRCPAPLTPLVPLFSEHPLEDQFFRFTPLVQAWRKVRPVSDSLDFGLGDEASVYKDRRSTRRFS